MKTIFSIIVFLHGLIHLLGFVKGFRLKEVKELSLPVSQLTGIIWLTAAVLTVLFGIFYLANGRYSWVLGFLAVAVSQILIILFWKDARFGTLPNILILFVSIVSFGNYNFQKLEKEETNFILRQSNLSVEKVISEDDVNRLPVPVKNWLVRSGMVGKPYIHAGKVLQQAEMKMKPGQQKWMSATALQYTTVDNPAFIWTVDLKMNSFLNFKGRDKFADGKGEMLIKLNSVFNVVNESGDKMDEGTLQRYLGEMVWFPTLAVSDYITWEQLDNNTAKATMNYKGTSGSGTFYFNSEGDFVRFSALRFMGNEADSKRHEWVLDVQGHSVFEGIKVPSEMTATWKLETGDWNWLKLKITDIKYNENVID